MRPNPSRRKFVAALALYVAWVGILSAMALTSAERPPSKPTPTSSPAQQAPSP